MVELLTLGVPLVIGGMAGLLLSPRSLFIATFGVVIIALVALFTTSNDVLLEAQIKSCFTVLLSMWGLWTLRSLLARLA